MEMLISGVVGQGDDKHACVLFRDGERSAEGAVPACTITENHGFTDEEVAQLEAYMKENISDIKAEAAKVNPIKAMMK